jgi:hypothetical protein
VDTIQVVAGHGPGHLEEAAVRGVREHLLLEAWRSVHGCRSWWVGRREMGVKPEFIIDFMGYPWSRSRG